MLPAMICSVAPCQPLSGCGKIVGRGDRHADLCSWEDDGVPETLEHSDEREQQQAVDEAVGKEQWCHEQHAAANDSQGTDPLRRNCRSAGR